ncbi:MAG: ATP-binding protein [Candidatus Parabeggiatoa sp. nov. 2]|nr:MAG: hypothetical protein B6247_16405 [Beggiatoa sp. 4572_84]RKZ57867.1 MAG: ATP-binding protein [Gammaproteobacteria bacterium]
MPKKNFAEILTEHLTRPHPRYEELAERVGVERNTLFRWREGQNLPNNRKHVLKLAQALRLNPRQTDELLVAANFAPENPDFMPDSHPNLPENEPIVPVTTRPIIHPCPFFGREAQLKRIFEAWNRAALEHIAVIGKKRSGKTSLLCYVKHIHEHDETTLRNGQRHHWLKQKTCDWVFVDFEKKQMQHPESFWRYLLKTLNLPIPNTSDWGEFTRVLEEYLANTTIILMDNIDKGLQLPELDKTFWGELRHLGNHCDGKVGFCVTSRQPINELVKLAEKLGESSPFSNAFRAIELGPLTEEEARTLLSYTSPPLSQKETDWILEQSQCWPAILQALCQIRLDCEGDEGWKKAGLEKIIGLEKKSYNHSFSENIRTNFNLYDPS